MLPDEYLAQQHRRRDQREDHRLAGHCEVHERFTAGRSPAASRESHPGVIVLAHPECPPEVVAEADFAGSTAGDVGLCRQPPPAARRAADRMLDERQRRRPPSGYRIRAAVQPLPAYEADHAGQYVGVLRVPGSVAYCCHFGSERLSARAAKLHYNMRRGGSPGDARIGPGQAEVDFDLSLDRNRLRPLWPGWNFHCGEPLRWLFSSGPIPADESP